MEFLDPRLGLFAAGAAMIGSERVRRTVGKGVGYTAAGAMRIGGPIVDAGRDIVEEARDVAGHNGGNKRSSRRAKSSSSS